MWEQGGAAANGWPRGRREGEREEGRGPPTQCAFFELHIGTKHQSRYPCGVSSCAAHHPLNRWLSRRPLLLFRSSHPLGEPLN